MKIIIASDIHGSLKYTQKLVTEIEKYNPEKIILLGDLYYHGPRNPLPEDYNCLAVANLLNTYKDRIIAVRGNCDAEVDQMISAFSLSLDYQTINIDNHEYILTHGHLFDKYPEFLNRPCLSGHTHIYSLNTLNINPGSVGLPKQNKEHTYILYDNQFFDLIDLDTGKVIRRRNINE